MSLMNVKQPFLGLSHCFELILAKKGILILIQNSRGEGTS